MSSLKFYEERRPSIVYEENIVVRRKGVTMTVRADALYVYVIYVITKNYMPDPFSFLLTLILDSIYAAKDDGSHSKSTGLFIVFGLNDDRNPFTLLLVSLILWNLEVWKFPIFKEKYFECLPKPHCTKL